MREIPVPDDLPGHRSGQEAFPHAAAAVQEKPAARLRPEPAGVFGALIEKMCRGMIDMTGTGLGMDPMELAMAMIREAPLRGLVTNDPRPEINRVWLQEMLDKLNGMLEE